MAKIGRNEPCPCGSGKKYKHCCANAAETTVVSEQMLDRQLEQLAAGVYNWGRSMWKSELSTLIVEHLGDSVHKVPWLAEPVEDFSTLKMTESEKEDLFLVLDSLVHDYRFNDGETMLQKYLARQESGMRTAAVQITALWKDSYISVYKIAQVFTAEERAELLDLFTGEKAVIDYAGLPMAEENVGDLLLVRLLGKSTLTFTTAFVMLPQSKETKMVEKVRFLKETRGATLSWPEFLKRYGYELYLLGSTLTQFTDDSVMERAAETVEWKSEKYKDVAVEIMQRMGEEFVPDDILKAIAVWSKYSEMFEPTIRKSEVIVATMEYVVHTLAGREVKQSEIANKYGVSTSSMNNHYQKIVDEVFPVMAKSVETSEAQSA